MKKWAISDPDDDDRVIATCDDETDAKLIAALLDASRLAQVDVVVGADGVVVVNIACEEPLRVFVGESTQVYGEPRAKDGVL